MDFYISRKQCYDITKLNFAQLFLSKWYAAKKEKFNFAGEFSCHTFLGDFPG